MESVSKKSGKVFTGKLAVLMHRIGAANLSDESEPPKKATPVKVVTPAKKVVPKKAAKSKVKK